MDLLKLISYDTRNRPMSEEFIELQTHQNQDASEDPLDPRRLLDTFCKHNMKNGDGNTDLHIAIRKERFQILDGLLNSIDVNQKSIDVNQNNIYGETALHIAAEIGSEETVRKLLERGAKVDKQDADGSTPIHSAFRSCTPNYQVIERLVAAYKNQTMGLQNTNENVNSKVQERVNISNSFDVIIDPPQDRLGNTPLHIAAMYMSSTRNDTIQSIKALNLYDPNVKNNNGFTALEIAARKKHLGIIQSILEVFHEHICLSMLDSVLNVSAMAANTEMVKMLIDHGADPRNGVLHHIVSESVRDPANAGEMVTIYREIVSSVERNFYRNELERNRIDKRYHTCKSCKQKSNGDEKTTIGTERDTIKKRAIEHMNSLLSAKFKGRTVSKLAVSEGALQMLREILRTLLWYRALGNFHSVQETDKVTGISVTVEGTDNAEQRVDSGEYTYCVEEMDFDLVKNIAEHNDKVRGEMLEIEPLNYIVSPYLSLARFFYAIVATIQILYMICFTIYEIPNKCRFVAGRGNRTEDFLLYNCSANESAYSNKYSHLITNSSQTKAFIIWPVVLLVFSFGRKAEWLRKELFYHEVHSKLIPKESDSKKNSNNLGQPEQNTKKVTKILEVLKKIILFIICFILLFLTSLVFWLIRPRLLWITEMIGSEKYIKILSNKNRVSIWSTLFPFSVIIWLCVFQYSQYEHYLACTAVVFIVGWFQVFCYISFFERYHIFWEILRKIVLRDIFKFFVLIVLVIIGFACAVVSIHQTEIPGHNSNLSLTDSVYQMFLEMLVPIQLQKTLEDPTSEGNTDLLRIILVIFEVLTAIILLNILIAMVSDTYSKNIETVDNTWKLSLVRLAILLCKPFDCWLCQKIKNGFLEKRRKLSYDITKHFGRENSYI